MRITRGRSVLAAAAAAAALVPVAAPAQAHGDYWTHLKCTLGAGTTATMDVSMTRPDVDGYSLISREDFATVRAFKPDKLQLMLSPYDFNVPTGASHNGPFMTIYTWGDGSRDSVNSSFGSTALAGNRSYPLLNKLDLLKLKVTDGGEVFVCQTTVGSGHS